LDTIVVALITGLLGILSGALASLLKFRNDLELSRQQFRNDLRAEYDKDLRERRIEVYKGLWHLLQYLGRYDRPKPLTPQTLQELTVEMRKWYFGGGGLYLSQKSRKTYFDLKETLRDVLDKTKDDPQQSEGSRRRYSDLKRAIKDVLDKTKNGLEDVPLDNEDTKPVLDQAHLLRDSLARDVGTRKPSAIAEAGEKDELKAIGMSMDWSGVTSEQYDRLREVVDWERDVPEGAILHVATFDSEGLHVFDVWESKEDSKEDFFQRFRDKRLMPGAQEAGIKGQPQVHTRPVHALFTPGLF
jgi:hypothetical protein